MNEAAIFVTQKRKDWRSASERASGRKSHRQEQFQRLAENRLKSVLSIEIGSCIVLGMHQKKFQPGDLGGLHRAQDRILEEGLAQAFSLLAMIDCQTGQQHNRDVVFAKTLDESDRDQLLVERSVNERVIGDNHLAVGVSRDVIAHDPALLVL